ncbi:hypothetical protein [Pseudolysinimonas sp.]|uniref:hypothetical protein n=1 Tax=Pseudolysinimonas sp. TaxID=2680009 RepID=UPI0037844288
MLALFLSGCSAAQLPGNPDIPATGEATSAPAETSPSEQEPATLIEGQCPSASLVGPLVDREFDEADILPNASFGQYGSYYCGFGKQSAGWYVLMIAISTEPIDSVSVANYDPVDISGAHTAYYNDFSNDIWVSSGTSTVTVRGASFVIQRPELDAVAVAVLGLL